MHRDVRGLAVEGARPHRARSPRRQHPGIARGIGVPTRNLSAPVPPVSSTTGRLTPDVSSACSISTAWSLRLASAGKSEGNETVSLDERFEIVSLAGTVSRHGAHLHMSLADYQGNVVGGHVMEGCEVFTTGDRPRRVRPATSSPDSATTRRDSTSSSSPRDSSSRRRPDASPTASSTPRNSRGSDPRWGRQTTRPWGANGTVGANGARRGEAEGSRPHPAKISRRYDRLPRPPPTRKGLFGVVGRGGRAAARPAPRDANDTAR